MQKTVKNERKWPATASSGINPQSDRNKKENRLKRFSERIKNRSLSPQGNLGLFSPGSVSVRTEVSHSFEVEFKKG